MQIFPLPSEGEGWGEGEEIRKKLILYSKGRGSSDKYNGK